MEYLCAKKCSVWGFIPKMMTEGMISSQWQDLQITDIKGRKDKDGDVFKFLSEISVVHGGYGRE